MYQSFTGTSRRTRQVNLSGRPSNPFAASSASGPQSAIASAQQDRANRQQQRERLQAASRIQRVWRSHSDRRKTFDGWRQLWDDTERVVHGHGTYVTEEESLRQLDRLLLFFDPRKDVKRLTWYGMRQNATSEVLSCDGVRWKQAYLKLERACVAALRVWDQREAEVDIKMLLSTLTFATRRTVLDRRDAISYYEALAEVRNADSNSLQLALLAPLQHSQEAYSGLGVMLARPLDAELLTLLRSSVDCYALAQALAVSKDHRSAIRAQSRLWLLGNTIYLAGNAKTDAFIEIIARLLGSLADEVKFEGAPVDLDNVSFDRDVLSKLESGLPMNNFLDGQLRSLINQDSIRNLLPREGSSHTTKAQILASYALTLLRCFPSRADDIRMWLYLGPMNSGGSDIPATRYFWNSVKTTSVFATIWENPRNVLSLIKASKPTPEARDEWTVILIFLELYTFLLKIIDDEEFMGNGNRPSAIPMSDTPGLVKFLKNLGFTICFNASELNNSAAEPAKDAESALLSRRFANGASPSDITNFRESNGPLVVAGLPGLTIDYLKGLVTGLLRAIYERDSRRHFLPPDHWLMMSGLDMASFIPSVVKEEESRHAVQDEDEEDRNAESDEDDVLDNDQTRFGSRNRLYARSNARYKAQSDRDSRRAKQRRNLESVAPRLEILQNMPFFIPFTTRVEIFRQFVELDQRKRRNGETDPDLWRHTVMMNPQPGMPPQNILARQHAKIRRKNEFGDAFENFYDLGPGLKEPIQITFVDEFDIPEAGIDGGGVTKEFLTSVISQAFDPDFEYVEKFFVENEKHLLYPNPTALEDLEAKYRAIGLENGDEEIRHERRSLLQQYEFLGRIIGKCLYEGILVDVNFAGFFLKKWALTGGRGSASMESGYRPNINDLRELDEGLYRGLLSLKNCPPEDVESLGLTFTIDDMVGSDDSKKVVERELIKNGSNIAVTSQNRLSYIHSISSYRLQKQSLPQTNAFLKGLGSIVQPSWLNMFNQSELQTLIGGAAAAIDVDDLRKNTAYGGTYVIGDDGQEHPSIQLFWKVMATLPDADRRAVLKFVTSTPRGPLLGFNHLIPRFSIRDSGNDENRFPTTSTCVNLLKLPMYKSERKLREKLLAAVNSGAGFDLS